MGRKVVLGGETFGSKERLHAKLAIICDNILKRYGGSYSEYTNPDEHAFLYGLATKVGKYALPSNDINMQYRIETFPDSATGIAQYFVQYEGGPRISLTMCVECFTNNYNKATLDIAAQLINIDNCNDRRHFNVTGQCNCHMLITQRDTHLCRCGICHCERSNNIPFTYYAEPLHVMLIKFFYYNKEFVRDSNQFHYGASGCTINMDTYYGLTFIQAWPAFYFNQTHNYLCPTCTIIKHNCVN